MKLLSTLLGFSLFLSIPALADDFGGRLDVSYSEANPDYSPFPNGEGVSLYGRLSYQDSWFTYLRYSDAEFRPSGEVQGDEVDVWQEVGLGYKYTFNELWYLEGAVSYQGVEQGNNDENGHEIQLGVGLTPIDALAFELSIGQIDVQIDDWNLDFETRYYFLDGVYAVAKLRDYADWDFTYYEGGLGITF